MRALLHPLGIAILIPVGMAGVGAGLLQLVESREELGLLRARLAETLQALDGCLGGLSLLAAGVLVTLCAAIVLIRGLQFDDS